MTISVRFHAQAREAVGCACEIIDTAGPISIAGLLRDLAGRHGSRLRSMVLTETGRPHPSLLLFVRDSQVRSDSTEHLADGTEVVMFSPIAGG
jgi:molybdopterin converting factor small subunit